MKRTQIFKKDFCRPVSAMLSLSLIFNIIFSPALIAGWVEEQVWVDGYYDIGTETWVGGHFETTYTWVPDDDGPDDDDNSTTEPIDTATGSNYFTEERLAVPCPGLSLELGLNYESITNTPMGRLGLGWRHSYEWSLVNETGQAVLYTGSGGRVAFEALGGGMYRSPEGISWELCASGGGYELSMSGGKTCCFDSAGKLSAIHDAWGNALSCSYDTNDCLLAVTHANGRQIVFSNSWCSAVTNWRIDAVSVPGGASLGFSYNSDGQFTQIVETVGANIYTSSYQYVDGFLTSKINGAGHEYTFGYETKADGHLNGKGTYLAVDGYYEHDVQYINADTTDVTYHQRELEQVYRYSRNDSGRLETRYGPGETVSQAQQCGISYEYAANHIDKTGETLFDDNTGTTWSQRLSYDSAHNITNLAVGYNTTNSVSQVALQYDLDWKRISCITDAETNRTEIVYTNASPLVQKMIYSGTNSYDTSFAYTTNGLLETFTNANGHVAHFTYNSSGDMATAAAEAGPIVSNTYNSLGFLMTREILAEDGSSSGRITQIEPDAKGRIVSITNPDGLVSSYRYNALGDLTNTIDRAGRPVDYSYAPNRKLTSITKYIYENGSNTPVRISCNYDEQFNTLSITEPRGRYVESYQFDIQDRIRAITNIEGQVMTLDYSVGSFVTNIARFDESHIAVTYDDAGRKDTLTYLSASHSPLATLHYTYYADSKLKSISDGTTSVTNTYDDLNRLTGIRLTTPDFKSHVSSQYDAVGNRTYSDILIQDLDDWPWIDITENSSYDEAERLISRGDRTYAYCSENGKIAMVSNTVSGLVCTYEYNLLDQLTNMVYTTGTNAIRSLQYTYDDVGMIKEKTITGGTNTVVHRYTYDSLDRLVVEKTVTASQTNQTLYTYDLAGNRLSKVSNGWKTQYTLGTGNRLDSVETLTNSTLYINGWADEPVGTDNRWGTLFVSNLTAGAVMAPGVNGSSFFGELPAVPGQTNRIVAAIRDRAGNIGYATNDCWAAAPQGTAAAPVSYSYDAAGCLTNMLSEVGGQVSGISLEWNALYQLTTSTVYSASTTSTVSYAYDVLGRRVSRIENGTATHFVYDGDHVVADIGDHAYLKRTYAYGPGIDNIQTMTVYANGSYPVATYHYIKDHQNTVIALTDGSGNIVESYEYDAWGNPTVFDASGSEISESALGNRYAFQGREYDFKTGLYYFRARWYDPQTGRWLSKDPIGISGGLNLYAFCGNNPVNFIDPMGLCEDDEDDDSWWKDIADFWNSYREFQNSLSQSAEGSGWAGVTAGAGAVGVGGNLVNAGGQLIGTGNPVGIVGGVAFAITGLFLIDSGVSVMHGAVSGGN